MSSVTQKLSDCNLQDTVVEGTSTSPLLGTVLYSIKVSYPSQPGNSNQGLCSCSTTTEDNSWLLKGWLSADEGPQGWSEKLGRGSSLATCLRFSFEILCWVRSGLGEARRVPAEAGRVTLGCGTAVMICLARLAI